MACWALLRRELLRSSRSGLWFLGAALFYEVYALYFSLILSSSSGGQPQPLSPLRWLMGGDLLVLSCFILPVLLVKAFAEERQSQTFEQLLCTGLSPVKMVLGKSGALLLQWGAWMLLLIPLLAVMNVFGQVSMRQVLVAWLGVFLIGIHWLSLGMFLSVRSPSVIGAFSKTAVGLLLYWSLPFVKLIWPDPFYRTLWDTFDFRAILERCSQGYILLSDVTFLLLGSLFWLILAVMRLELEGGSKWSKIKKMITHGVTALVMMLIIYTTQYIGKLRPTQWDLTASQDEKFTDAYRSIAKTFPKGLQITAVLPRRLSVSTYGTARDLILSFLTRTTMLNNGVTLRVLDPDVDGLEMDRLRQEGVASQNKIGFVLLKLGERSLILSYHQWVSLGTMTLDNEPHHFIRKFHGESIMVRAVNSINRSERRVRAVALRGFGELDLADKGRLGGSAFAELLQQLGLDLEWVRPGVETLDLEGVDLLLVLDPRQAPSEVYLNILTEAKGKGIPVLALNSAIGHLQPGEGQGLWSPYGVESLPHVVYQRQFPNFDPYTMPIHEHSSHAMMAPLKGQMMIMDRCRLLQEGLPDDPRLVTKPLLRVHGNEMVWGESSARLDEGGVRHTFDSLDVASPLLVSMVVEEMGVGGKRPVLVVSSSRAPFENRFFFEAGNRNFVYQCIDGLVRDESRVSLPPQAPLDHRMNFPEWLRAWLLWLVTLGGPMLLAALWWWRCRR